MSDWEIVPNEQTKNYTPKSDWQLAQPKSEWEVSSQDPEESYWKKIPRSIAIGLANLGHNVINTPYELGKGIESFGKGFEQNINEALPIPEKMKNLLPGANIRQQMEEFIQNNNIPESMVNPNWRQNKSFAEQIPHQQEYDFDKMLGQEGEPDWTNYLIQKGVEHAPELGLGANALKSVSPHLTKRGATKTLNLAKKLAAEREIGTLNVNPEIIEDARQFLPNLLQNRNELNASHAGDYNSLFNLQSNVGKISAQRQGKLKKIFAPESQLKGEAGLEARKNLLNAIHENLNSLGHKDISDLLKQGQNEYRRYMKYRNARNIIGGAGLVYVAPKNPLTDLLKQLWLNRGQ